MGGEIIVDLVCLEGSAKKHRHIYIYTYIYIYIFVFGGRRNKQHIIISNHLVLVYSNQARKLARNLLAKIPRAHKSFRV